MKYLTAIIGLLILSSYLPTWSKAEEKSKSHGHSHEEEESAHADGHDKDDHAEKKDEHGHGEHEEEEAAPNVGPDKGIIEASEEDGIKLSPEALKNFGIKTIKLTSQGPWSVPISARLLAAEEVNLYRVRAGAFKRVDFNVVKKASDTMMITSSDLKAGDEIVISGIGFLRIAEISAFGGAPEGHSH
jgi:hypothetical protein